MGIARRLVSQDGTASFPFIFKITTTAVNTVFTCPLVDYGTLTPNLNIQWGDGQTSPLILSSTDVNRIHTYSMPGTYTITIIGLMPGFKVNNNSAIRLLITELVQWGIVGLRTIDFYGCQNLTNIPGSSTLSAAGGYTGLSEVVAFTSFMRGTRLTSIPSDIFDYSPNATSFTDCFSSITTITSVPTGLFNNVPAATTFANAFLGCASLTTVPSTLFDSNPNVLSFSGTFRNCLQLTNVLQFTYNTSVNNFSNIYNMTTTANALVGTAPTIWSRSPIPLGTNAFNNCFGLTNYASIPANFK